jgi:CRISPR-associated protein Cas5t
MNTISLRVYVPFCSFRKPYAREFLETERVPPPATVYGFLLSLIGEEDRYKYTGSSLALSVIRHPAVSTVLRTAWRVKTKKVPPGTGNNKRPDYQEILSDLVLGVWVSEGALANQLRIVADTPELITRFGGLSLGESRDLVNVIEFQPQWTGNGLWLVPSNDGDQPLPVWVDHVGSKGTHWIQFTLTEAQLIEPSPGDERWISIGPA